MKRLAFDAGVLKRLLVMVALTALGVFVGASVGQFVVPKHITTTLACTNIGLTILALAVWLPSWQRFDSNLSRIKPAVPLILALMIAVVLSTSITAVPLSQDSTGDRIAGFMPYSDAGGYYRQVLSWPAAHFDEWNTRRPWNAVLNIAEHRAAGGTMLGMHVVRVVFASLAIAAFAAAVARFVGWAAASLSAFVLVYFTYPYASSCLSELNGITVSAAGTSIFFMALDRKSVMLLVVSILGLSLAYALRPYNPLWVVLVAGVGTIWMFHDSPRRWWRVCCACVLAGAISLLVQLIPLWMFGAPGGASNSHTGYVVLGLARGTNWQEAGQHFAKASAQLSESDRNAEMWAEAISTMRANPKPMMQTLMRSTARAAFTTQQEFGMAFGMPRHLAGRGDISMGDFFQYVGGSPTIWLSSLLFIGSVVSVISFGIRSIPAVFVGVTLAALFSFAPVVFTDGGFRSAATHYPGLALAAVGLPVVVGRRWSRTGGMQKNLHVQSGLEDRAPWQGDPRLDFAGTSGAVGGLIVAAALVVAPLGVLSLWIVGASQTPPLIVRIEPDSATTARWTGWNEAIASHEHLVKWAEAECIDDLAEVIRQLSIDAVSFDLDRGPCVFIESGTPTQQQCLVLDGRLCWQVSVPATGH